MDNNQYSARKRRVLVADDDMMVRMLIREALEELGLVVEAVGDGTEAVELFEKSRNERRFLILRTHQRDTMDNQ